MKYLRFPKFRHLKNQLLFQNALSISLIIGLTAVFTYNIAIKIQVNEAIRYNTVMVTQISKSIDDMVESFNDVMDGVTFNNEIQRLLQIKYDTGKEMHLLNKYLASQVVDETVMFNEVDLINLYDTENLRVNLRRSVNNKDFKFFNELRPDMYDSSGRVTWRVENSVITANRLIYGIHSYKMNEIGYLTMSMKTSYLEDRIQKYDPTEERHIIILDQENNVVLTNAEDSGNDAFTSWASDLDYNSIDSESFVDIPGDGRMIVNNYQSELTGWKIISLVSLNEISAGPVLIGRTIFLIGFVAIVIGIVVIWISTHYIVKPLNQLRLVMDEVEKDNFHVQVQINRKDELGRVGDSFNKMMNKINNLISDIYQKDINEKEAQLRALRAQINPHFLYNTLDAINWMAQFDKTDEVSKMTIALSRLLKSSISNNKEFIRLEEEAKYIDDYMTIQKIRFQDKIHYSMQIDEAAKNCLVPKLILQPIVENAMIHGLEKKLENGYLLIKGYVKNDLLHIQIIDNGVGMDERTMSALLKGVYVNRDENKGTGNGILNVQNRIKLLFGREYGLKIDSNENVGSVFEMTLPVHREGYKNV
ncbi:sensor histidine kinase [Bacillus infantis]|uniref:cache domain-containing sensor histidine kinase n=1 Tax=Bacillus infantis TaxID=324767 RepID=UPI001CD42C92|nr:sensor histidine kinase [Bacillus infantis]MCA1033506.1 sensor histidine kinase [Bacillus infantis]